MPTKRQARVFAVSLLTVAITVANAQDAQQAQEPTAPTTAPAASQQPAPRLVLSTKEWNFGQLWYGDPCKTEVELKNTGNATLKITRVKSSCGCMAARPKKKELAPGETDIMTVTYDTTKDAKRISQIITIITNDPVEPEVKFRVRGEVWHVFDAKPSRRLTFGHVQLDSQKTKAIMLHNNLPEKVFPKLKPLGSGIPFDVELKEVKAGMTYKLVVRTKPPLPPGNTLKTVLLETGVERLPIMPIRVSIVGLDRVSVRPDRLWVTSSRAKSSSRTVRLSYAADRPVEITELKSSHPAVTLRQLPERKPPTSMSEFTYYQIRVTLPPYAELPDEGVKVEIHTNDPDPKFQKFVVPIEKYRPGSKRTVPKPVQKPKPGTPTGKPD